MSEWNFMDPQSKDNLLRVVRQEAEQMWAMAEPPEVTTSSTTSTRSPGVMPNPRRSVSSVP